MAPRPEVTFRREDYENKGNNTERKSFLGSSPGEDGFYSSATKHESICRIFPQ
jgi:hypothetical protein